MSDKQTPATDYFIDAFIAPEKIRYGLHPPLAVAVFADLDRGDDLVPLAPPAGIDENTYLWTRELVRRYRRLMRWARSYPSADGVIG